MTDITVEAAHQLSLWPDRAVFFVVIAIMGAGLIWIVRYLINDFKETRNMFHTNLMELVEKHAETTKDVTATVSRNTVALDNNAAIIKDCQTEIKRCREGYERK